MQDPIFKTREEARVLLTEKLERERDFLARLYMGENLFSTFDPRWIIEDAEWRLRWIDCAPEGANHQCAPLQDKQGVPMGGVVHENLGAPKNIRELRLARGRHPLTGRPLV
jgi:hypothetical protein